MPDTLLLKPLPSVMNQRLCAGQLFHKQMTCYYLLMCVTCKSIFSRILAHTYHISYSHLGLLQKD